MKNNLVQKHMNKFNKPSTHKSEKDYTRKMKHKKGGKDLPYFLLAF